MAKIETTNGYMYNPMNVTQLNPNYFVEYTEEPRPDSFLNSNPLDRPYMDLYDWNDTYHFGNVPVDILNRRSHYLLTFDADIAQWIIVNDVRMPRKTATDYGPIVVKSLPVARYTELTDALQALYCFNLVGFHTKQPYLLRQLIISYINKENGINETILGMMVIYALDKIPEYQQLHMKATAYGIQNLDMDLPIEYRASLHNYKTNKPDSLIALYSDLYDAFVKFGMFKDKKYKNVNENEIDLKNETLTFIEIIKRYLYKSGEELPIVYSAYFEYILLI